MTSVRAKKRRARFRALSPEERLAEDSVRRLNELEARERGGFPSWWGDAARWTSGRIHSFAPNLQNIPAAAGHLVVQTPRRSGMTARPFTFFDSWLGYKAAHSQFNEPWVPDPLPEPNVVFHPGDPERFVEGS